MHGFEPPKHAGRTTGQSRNWAATIHAASVCRAGSEFTFLFSPCLQLAAFSTNPPYRAIRCHKDVTGVDTPCQRLQTGVALDQPNSESNPRGQTNPAAEFNFNRTTTTGNHACGFSHFGTSRSCGRASGVADRCRTNPAVVGSVRLSSGKTVGEQIISATAKRNRASGWKL